MTIANRLMWLYVATVCLGISGQALSQYQNVRISRITDTDPEEVSIAINPSNPLNLIAGANLYYAYWSFDGGLTWKQRVLSSALGVWGDPSVAFSLSGTSYYGHLANPPYPGHWIDRIVVHRSIDGGLSWQPGIGVGLNPPKVQDKEWIAVDNTGSQYKDNVYTAWTEFDVYGSSSRTDSSRILFSRSTDEGFTWSGPVRVSDRGGDCLDADSTVEGAVPAIGPEGQIYLSWASPQGIMFDKSTDGGLTFGEDRFVTSEPGGWDFDIPGIWRCNGLPVTGADASNSPYRGNIYIQWSDQRSGVENTDVFFIRSTNEGKTWDQVKKVNTDTSKRHQFFSWMAVDQVTGYIYVVFYDRRSTAGSATEVYIARSADGGETFQDFKISSSPFTPEEDIFFGDYINIAAYDRHVCPIWMRMDSAKLSVWTAIILDTVTSVAQQKNMPSEFTLYQNYPNPFNPATSITYEVPAGDLGPKHVGLMVYDIFGRTVATLADGAKQPGKYTVSFDGGRLSAGVYYCRLRAADYTCTKKMILVR